jgi:hypothetical protein
MTHVKIGKQTDGSITDIEGVCKDISFDHKFSPLDLNSVDGLDFGSCGEEFTITVKRRTAVAVIEVTKIEDDYATVKITGDVNKDDPRIEEKVLDFLARDAVPPFSFVIFND